MECEECSMKRKYTQCSCDKLKTIRYTCKGISKDTNIKFKSIESFRNWCSLAGIDSHQFDKIEVVE